MAFYLQDRSHAVKKMKASAVYFVLLFCFILLTTCTREKENKIILTERELGEKLFFDPILSRDSSVSCSSCHKPEFAFADTTAFSKGVYNRTGNRNTPSAMNQADRNFYFWDGRAETLEEQALGPMENHVEMDFPLTLTVKRLLRNALYKKTFMVIYGKRPSKELIAQAIAAYEKSLETSNTVFDKYVSGDDTTLFGESEKRGLQIFNTKGKCFDCHFGVDFTGSDQFKNIGLYNGENLNDKGRYVITGLQKDLGTFKVPGLRNIAQTAPYMHNGMFRTLKGIINYYNEPDKFVDNSINRDILLSKPLGLNETEKKDLENFLLSLSDERFLKKGRH
jgi:cytochrome c peroxidase